MSATSIEKLQDEAAEGEPPQQALTIRDLFAQHRDQITAALPKHLDADRMVRLATTAIRRTPRLQEADAISLFGAIITSSQLGLEPGLTAHLVPFYNKSRKTYEVQCIPDYRGIMDIARRSGDVTTIVARVVREGDFFEFVMGTSEYIKHIPQGPGTTDVVAAYAVAYVKGDPQIEVMTLEQIQAIRGRSQAGGDGPWVTDFAEMARKTVVKRLCKYLPMSIEYRELARLDDLAEAGKPQHTASIITGEIVDEKVPA